MVVPTIGRRKLLEACLRSVAECRPAPAEIVLVDQSGQGEVAELVFELDDDLIRVVRDDGRGVGRAVNAGMQAAASDLVLVTHDDCTVAGDWVEVAVRLMAERPDGIITGRVLPVGDPSAVPSTKTDPEPHDYTGTQARAVLWPMNMACSRRAFTGFGGFDELNLSAEDNEFCYRWLKAGRPLRYTPELIVSHHEWRGPRELRRLHRRYARGDGMFYGKHLLRGDLTTLGYLIGDLRLGVRGELDALRNRRRPWWDSRLGVLTGLPMGLWDAWRAYGLSRRR